MSDIKPIPQIPSLAGTPQAPERVGERMPERRRYKKQSDADRIELHSDADLDVENIEPGADNLVEAPNPIDFRA